MADVLPCPTCRSPVVVAPERRPAAFPFCSTRCRNADLGAWSDGRYVIAGRTLTPEDLEARADRPIAP
jgi:endogenous inhibitor of DNA gyrase (YacG/DUF329 family)